MASAVLLASLTLAPAQTTPPEEPATPAAPTAPAPGEPPAAPVDPAVQKILDELGKVSETVTKTRTGNNLGAYERIKDAMASDSKAVDLMLDCFHELNFKSREKKETEWRDWREKNAARFKEAGYTKALRLQLQYLALTIRAGQAVTEKEKEDAVMALISHIDDVVKSADKELVSHRGPLDENVLSTIVARHFKLENSVALTMPWVYQAGDISAMYENVILPRYRAARDTSRLANAWRRRMEQQMTMATASGIDFDKTSFMETILPRLEWGEARDQYLAGNPSGSSMMLAVIKKYPGFKETPVWILELREFLQNPKSVEAAATAAANPKPAAPTAAPAPPTPATATEPPKMPPQRTPGGLPGPGGRFR